MLKLRLFFFMLFAVVLAGCHSFALADDMQVDFNFTLVPTGPTDDLHLPYVQGTSVAISVLGTDSSNVSRFTLVSDDPTVLSVGSMDKTSATASCTATGAGSTTVHVLLDGSEVASSQVSVAAPTHAVLQPAGPLFVGDPISLDADGTTQVLNGGTATYMIQYFEGSTLLFGHGVLQVSPSAGIDATPEETFFLQEREWLQVTPTALGKQTVTLSAAGVALGTLKVTSLDASDVTSVSVEAEDASNAHDGDELLVLAQSFDEGGQPIFGVTYDWNLAGEEATGEGDLFEFPLASGQSNTITAQFGSFSGSTSIDAKPGTGFVGSSNAIGCTAASGPPAGSWAALGLAAAVAFTARRRRAR
jgi:MYXO-CTERM domain-containing protein